MKVNWKQKLTSRKFWAALISFVTALLVAFGVGELEIEQVVAVIGACASMIAYIIGEGLVDASRAAVASGSEEKSEVAGDES